MTETTESDRRNLRTRTKLVYAGRHPSQQYGFVNTPIYRGSTVLFPTYHDLITRNARFAYGTQGSPTTEALAEAWTEFSDAAGTVLAPTGLAAITLALLTAVKAGDHILVIDSIYRPTRIFCDTILTRMGVETTYFDAHVGDGIEHLIRANTSVVFLETPGSQTFEVPDVPAIAAIARGKGACVILDNTWATPLFFPPHDRGADMAIEAGTKYLSGHSDLLLGLVSATPKWLARLKGTADAFAMCPGPEDVFLALRGLRTLELRLREAERQALDVAQWLEGRAEVAAVLHPALPACPGHALWKRDFLALPDFFRSCWHPVRNRLSQPCWTGLNSSDWAFRGAASKASSFHSTAAPIAPPLHGDRRVTPCGSISVLRTRATSRRTSIGDLSGCATLPSELGAFTPDKFRRSAFARPPPSAASRLPQLESNMHQPCSLQPRRASLAARGYGHSWARSMWANADATDPLSKPPGMSTLRFALLGLAALVVIFLGWTFLHQTTQSTGPASAASGERRMSSQEVAAMQRTIERSIASAKDYTGFFERLKAAFPAEYDGFMTRVAERAAGAGETANADALMIEAARDLRRSHGILAAKADGAVLDNFFGAKRSMLDALAAKNQTLCVDFLYGGADGDFSAFSHDHRGLLAAMANAELDAINDGQVNRVDRDPPNDEDFRTLENALRAQGVSNAAIGALLDGKAPNPPLDDSEMCQAGQVFLQTLAVLPEAARRRIYGFAIALMAHS